MEIQKEEKSSMCVFNVRDHACVRFACGSISELIAVVSSAVSEDIRSAAVATYEPHAEAELSNTIAYNTFSDAKDNSIA